VKTLVGIIGVGLILCGAGCQNDQNQIDPLRAQIEKLTEEKAQLQKQLAAAEKKNSELEKRLKVLSALPDRVKGENLYRLQTVRISKYTNLYDKDEDGKKEKLIVYLQPIDEDGDIIKVAGSVEVELWDLSKDQQQALLGRWRIEPGQLKKLWFATILRSNYRLMFDVPEQLEQFTEPLTVKVTFTDCLSGRVFHQQRLIKPLD